MIWWTVSCVSIILHILDLFNVIIVAFDLDVITSSHCFLEKALHVYMDNFQM